MSEFGDPNNMQALHFPVPTEEVVEVSNKQSVVI